MYNTEINAVDTTLSAASLGVFIVLTYLIIIFFNVDPSDEAILFLFIVYVMSFVATLYLIISEIYKRIYFDYRE